MSRSKKPCVYLGPERPGKLAKNGNQLFDCRIHEQCTIEGRADGYAACPRCRERLPPDASDFADRYKDGLPILDRWGRSSDALRGILAGGPAFLVCGGPSAKLLSLERLSERGIWTLCVNNAAGYGDFVPNAFVCADPPSKFCDGIWMDSNVMKFIPTPKMRSKRGRLRRKTEDGFEPLVIDGKRVSACDAPNVWGFQRRSWMMPDDSFFLEQGAAWGNHDSGVTRTGEQKTVCTMLIGLRLLYYLGARVIFLVGVDFQMDPSLGLQDNYSFGENRDRGACESNNRQFSVVNPWLVKMADDGVFQRFGLQIFNCNENSGLRAFPHVAFSVAIMESKVNIPDEPFDLRGWYEK